MKSGLIPNLQSMPNTILFDDSYSLSFDGSNDNVSVANANGSLVIGTGSGSVFAWVNSSSGTFQGVYESVESDGNSLFTLQYNRDFN